MLNRLSRLHLQLQFLLIEKIHLQNKIFNLHILAADIYHSFSQMPNNCFHLNRREKVGLNKDIHFIPFKCQYKLVFI